MPKVTLEFEDGDEINARHALESTCWVNAMQDLDQELRGVVKYGASIVSPGSEASEEEVELALKMRDRIREIISCYNLKFDI